MFHILLRDWILQQRSILALEKSIGKIWLLWFSVFLQFCILKRCYNGYSPWSSGTKQNQVLQGEACCIRQTQMLHHPQKMYSWDFTASEWFSSFILASLLRFRLFLLFFRLTELLVMRVLDYILTNRTKTIYFYLPLSQTENSKHIYHCRLLT